MAKYYAIVVKDPDKVRAHLIDVNLRAQRAARTVSPHEEQRLRADLSQRIGIGAAGALHAAVESFDCPDGLPNCRHCGDPAYAGACRAAGHCPYCGTRHGVAPASVIEDNDLYELIEFEGADAELARQHTSGTTQWDPARRKFVARPPQAHGPGH